MAKRISVTTLNASTIDILNTIRANASYEYQQNVPEVTTEHDIPAVGEVLYGYPALANQFINALVNRIALVKIKSATFNNDYAELKKGYLEFGETVEEVFVSIAKAREFSAEKAEKREFKRTLPDVRSAFHAMNWRVQYPITIQNEDLRMAFTGFDGVEDLIAKIVDSVYVAEQYDEFLLFKYLMIKAITKGKMYPVAISSEKNAQAVQFRGVSNDLKFIKTKYNVAGVHTNTNRDDQYIFMDSFYNADFDVNVLASAFNMDKAEFMGKLKLIDDWTTFDNDRFDEIRANSDMIEEVTDEELALMSKVRAVLVDKEWFQIYDNLSTMSEDYVAAGLYWNYFYNTWKTVSSSPFSNAVVFVDDTADTTLPDSIDVKVLSKDVNANATVITLGIEDTTALVGCEGNFVQTGEAVAQGVAVHKYGAIIYPTGASAVPLKLVVNGTEYSTASNVASSVAVGDTITFNSGETPVGPVDNLITELGYVDIADEYQSIISEEDGIAPEDVTAAMLSSIKTYGNNGNVEECLFLAKTLSSGDAYATCTASLTGDITSGYATGDERGFVVDYDYDEGESTYLYLNGTLNITTPSATGFTPTTYSVTFG